MRERVRGALVVAMLIASATGCSAPANAPENGAVYDAWRAQQSRVEVDASGSVARLLGERSGRYGPHAGFLLHLSGGASHGLTVRVEVNERFTGPLPLVAGEPVQVRGEYEFDPRGGVIHWTHRDPRRRHPDGYIVLARHRYG